MFYERVKLLLTQRLFDVTYGNFMKFHDDGLTFIWTFGHLDISS